MTGLVFNRTAFVLAALLSATTACTDTPDTSVSADELVAIGLTTDKTSYAPGDNVSVTFDGFSGSETDWVAIAQTGSPDSAYMDWQYTGGGNSGTVTFTAPALTTGSYEARAYFDWNGTHSLTVQKRVAFTVGTTISTSAASYTPGQPVVVNFGGLPGNPKDWIALAPSGSPNSSYTVWAYTNGQANGSLSFENVPSGTYVARSLENDTFTVLSQSAPFTVGFSAVAVTPSQASYTPADQISIGYTGLPGNATDWIAIAPAGAAPQVYVAWTYATGATGTATFDALPAGNYEARAFLHDNYELAGSATFTVVTAPSSGVTVTPAQPAFSESQSISIAYAGLPGNPTDWIAIAPAGAPLTTYVDYVYATGPSGTASFGSLPAGQYEARAFLHDNYILVASATFSVSGAPSVATDMGSYGLGETVVVNYGGLPGNAKDWIAIATAGSPNTSYVQWTYVNGNASGSASFMNLNPGSYVARAFANDGYTLLGEAAFTVGNAASVTTAASYTTADSIVVNFAGLPGNANDWIAISAAGSTDAQYIDYKYTAGAASGSVTFTGLNLAPGTYEARAYLRDLTTTKVATTTFTVTAAVGP